MFIIFLMGNSNSQNNSTLFAYHHVIQQRANDWAGKYALIQDSFSNDTIIKKVIYLRSHQEAKIFVQRYKEQQKLDFYVINPVHVQLVDQQRICSFTSTALVFHKLLLPNLAQKIHRNRQILKQHEIWFIMNEICHSLKILHSKGHPHLWINQNTIFCNRNQNWFLHDMHYWRGTNYQSNIFCQLSSGLIRQKLYNNQLMSNELKSIVIQDSNADLSTLMDEDIYAFGYSVLYMMTMADYNELKRNPEFYLQKSQSNYSQKLIYLTKLMIHQNPDRRISLQKLRHRLKVQQEKIMKQQMAEFKREKSKSRRDDARTRERDDNTGEKFRSKRHKNQLTPQTHPTVAETFQTSENRRNLIYFSPPSHRVQNRNGFNSIWDGRVNQFRYNSPR